MNCKEIEKIPMFFIMGSPRSGTTMLQQILDGSPNLIVPLESQFMIVLKKKYFKEKNWTKEKVDEFVDGLTIDGGFRLAWETDNEILRKACHSIPLSEITFSILCKVVYLNFPSIYKKEEIRFIGDKNPEYAMHLKALLEIFPDAKIIHIVRDYRPNILSNRKWFYRKNIMMLAQKWLLFNQYIEKIKRKGNQLFYTIRYEDLVEYPEKYSKEICEFIGIEFLPKMLNFHEQISNTYIKDKARHEKKTIHVRLLGSSHENLVKPINKEKVDSWKQVMTKEELIMADYVDGDFAQKYGYKKETHVRNFKLFIKSKLARIRYKMDVLIIREYYNLPLWTRPVLRFIAEKLYDWFGIVHVYNSKYRKRKELSKGTK